MKENRNYPDKGLYQIINPQKRFKDSEKLSKLTGCKDIILYDHINPDDPSKKGNITSSIKTSLGYEKCLEPAIPFSSDFNVNVLMQVPPLPSEMKFARKLYDKVPDSKPLHVWLPDGNGKFSDGYELYQNAPKAYRSIVKSAINNPPPDDMEFHIRSTPDLMEQQNIEKAVVMPFQTTSWHYEKLGNLIKEEKVIIPDSAEPWINKGKAHDFFTRQGLGHLFPATELIDMRSRRENNQENIEHLTKSIENASSQMLNEGKSVYIKVAANGLAGFGNIPPKINPLLEKDIAPEARSDKFQKLVNGILEGNDILPDAVVEENLNILSDNEGKREHIVSGIIIGGEFRPWSISRSINDDLGRYQGAIISPDLKDVGLTAQGVDTIVNQAGELAGAMTKSGKYNTGYVAKDFVVVPDGHNKERNVFHDHNDRRGGRSVLETTVCLLQKGFLDRNHTIHIPEGADHAEYVLDVTDRLYEEGMLSYGTGSVYTPHENAVTLRVLSPLNLLKRERKQSGSGDALSEIAINTVQSIVEKENIIYKKRLI